MTNPFDAAKSMAKNLEHTAGSLVSGGSGLVGDGLNALGLHGAASGVKAAGSELGYSMGADTPELELGQTSDPRELIHGDASALRSSASRLNTFSSAFGDTASGLKAIDTGHWEGAAADAFRSRFSSQPAKWGHAQEASGRAGAALESYAGAVEDAQAKARQAIDLWQQGQEATAKAKDSYNQEVSRYNAAAAARQPGLAKPAPFTDPGESLRNEARQLLDSARSSLAGTAASVESELASASALAPATSAWADLEAMGEAAVLDTGSELGGVLQGVAGINRLASKVMPVSPASLYNAEHPNEAAAGYTATLAGLADGVADPGKLVKGVVGSGWTHDPGKAFGKLLPNVALAVGTDGAGTGADAATAVGENAGRAEAEDAAAQAAKDQAAGEQSAATKADDQPTTGDPVNVATGEVVFAQPDFVLPGPLPLVIERTHQSQRLGGRWLGEQWTSTLDQRLLLTPEKVAAVFADGRALFWPKPGADDGEVLTVTGPPWSLRRDGDEAYEVTDRQEGLTWRYEWQEGAGRVGEDLGEMPLVSVTDRAGRAITFSYTETGAPAAIAHSGGYRITVTTENGRATSLSLDGVRLVTYAYDDAGDLTGVVNSSGQALRFGYDTRRRMTGWTDRLGNSYAYAYDENGRCVQGTSPSGMQEARFAYKPGRTLWTDATGEMTAYEIDDLLQVASVTDPLGNVTRLEYDARGRKVATTDPLGHVTRLEYDAPGNLVSVTRPDGSSSRVEYDQRCLPVRVTGPDGAGRRQSYDERGNLVEETGPDGAVTRYAYDERGNLARVTAPGGAVTTVTCNAAGLPVEVTAPDGQTTQYRRDQFGRIARTVGPAGEVTALTWTVEGRPVSRTLPDGSAETWEWDADGHQTRHVSPSGAVISREYGPFDTVTALTAPDGRRTEFAYDNELRVTAVTQAGLSWRYEYDEAGRLVAETDFNGSKTLYQNGPSGLCLSRVNATGQETTYAYDALGNLVSQAAGGVESTFEYDPAGRLIRARNPVAEIQFSRDRAGRVTSETCNGHSLTTMYDPAGRAAGRTTPSGVMTQWAYDPAGRPAVLFTGGRELRFSYGPGGRETRRDLPGGAALVQGWDAAGRLASQVLTGPGGPVTLQRRSYAYNPDGLVTGTGDLLAGPRAFGLDDSGRVTTVTGPDWAEQYAYDPAGNVISAAWPEGPRGPRAARGTRIVQAGEFSYRYDDAGRVVLRTRVSSGDRPDAWRYQWDADNRLVAVATPDGSIWRYSYDPLGRRVAKERRGPDGAVLSRTRFTWDGLVLAEQAETSGGAESGEQVTTWNYQPGTFTPLTQSSGDQRFWAIVADLTGTPSELVGADGALAGRQRHALWGSTAWEPGGDDTPLRFPGQYADDETGLHYNNQRYYDPVTGAYLTPDPLGLAPAPNPHAYVANPHVLIDPLGLTPGNAAPPTGTQVPRDVQIHLRHGLDGGYDAIPDNARMFEHDLRPGDYATSQGGMYPIQGAMSSHNVESFLQGSGQNWAGAPMPTPLVPGFGGQGVMVGAVPVG